MEPSCAIEWQTKNLELLEYSWVLGEKIWPDLPVNEIRAEYKNPPLFEMPVTRKCANFYVPVLFHLTSSGSLWHSVTWSLAICLDNQEVDRWMFVIWGELTRSCIIDTSYEERLPLMKKNGSRITSFVLINWKGKSIRPVKRWLFQKVLSD